MVFRCNIPLYPITIGTLLDEAVLNINTALQIEFVQPLQPSGQSMLQGQSKKMLHDCRHSITGDTYS